MDSLSPALEPGRVKAPDTGLELASRVQPPAADTVDPSALPKWQYVYLTSLGAGLSDHEARQQANGVSWASVDSALQESAAMEQAHGVEHPSALFHRAYAMVVQGRRIAGLPALREHSVDLAQVALQDAFRESRDPGILPRDRLGNRRLVLETAGAIGAAAAQGATVAVQVQVYPGGYSARLREAEAQAQA